MTLVKLYESIGGDYDEIMGRLGMEQFVERIVVRFLDDESCKNILTAWAAGDEAATFSAAHMAKGVCGNLALTRLADLSSQVCEALRPGNDELRAATDVDALVAELNEAYAATVAAIEEFRG